MKKPLKIFISIAVAVLLLYALVAAALAATGTCPKYINTIPSIRENDPSQEKVWYIFCPLSKRS